MEVHHVAVCIFVAGLVVGISDVNHHAGASSIRDDDWQLNPVSQFTPSFEEVMYTQDRGIAIGQAIEEIETRERLQPILDMAESLPGFAGAWIDRSSGLVLVVRFAGDVPTEIADAGRGLPVDFRGGASFSIRSLMRQQSTLREDLLAHGFTDLVSGIDVFTGNLEVTVQVPSGQRAPRGLVPDSVLASNVSLLVESQSIGRDEHTYGGDSLVDDDGVFRCTTGFVVTDGSEDGVLTAGHCPNELNYQENSGNTYDALFKAQYKGYYGDYQWHTTSHTGFNKYYFNDTIRRSVPAIGGAPAVDDYRCFHGEASGGNSCDYVYMTMVNVVRDGVSYERLVAMDSDNTIGGDSGGPWFSGSTAWGIHKGDETMGGTVRNIWSQARFVNAALGVTIRTS